MPLTQPDWREIQAFVNRMISNLGESFVQGVVVDSDPQRKVVFLKEFGDTPIPIIGFDYQVKYSYEHFDGTNTTTRVKKTKAYSTEVEILVPRKGDVVLVAQQFGSRRLPKCLGVVKSKRYVAPAGE